MLGSNRKVCLIIQPVQIAQLAGVLQDDATKWQTLRPFLVASPKRGIIGNSKYAMRLRRDILEAARDPTRCDPHTVHHWLAL